MINNLEKVKKNSFCFNRLLVMGAILVNAIITATMHYHPGGRYKKKEATELYYYIEVGFTAFFDLETLFKIWCLGPRGYFQQPIHKFELLLAIGTSFHIMPNFYLTGFTYFQVRAKLFSFKFYSCSSKLVMVVKLACKNQTQMFSLDFRFYVL